MAYELPELPYAYDALEPHIDSRTMEIHHSKHHQGYTNNLNAAIAGTDLEGKSISEIGVSPDIEVSEDSESFRIRTETDNQLKYAIKLLNG